MNEPRHPTPYPPPQHANHPQAHPQAPQIHPAPPRPVVVPSAAPAPVAPPARPGIAPMPTMKPHDDDLDPIELVDEEPLPAAPTGPGSPARSPQQPAPKKIIAFGADGHRTQHQWKRQPVKTGEGACRVRSFHGKYSEQGLDYLDNAINEWLDNHPEIEVKFVTSTVMTFEGKIREPALVLNVWY